MNGDAIFKHWMIAFVDSGHGGTDVAVVLQTSTMDKFNAISVVLGIILCFTDEAITAPAATVPPLIYFKDGLFGVNFLGFHAAAGLKGLTTGGGGLHAEAGTPFGQRAAAGLGGVVGKDGSVAGNLYAGATAGGNVKAAAGLGGAVVGGDSPRAAGTLYSASSAGAAKAGTSISGGISNDVSYNVIEKIADVEPIKVADSNVVVTKVSTAYPATHVDKQVVYVRGHPVKFNRFFTVGNVPTEKPTYERIQVTPEEAPSTSAPATAAKEVVQPSTKSPVVVRSGNEPRTIIKTKYVTSNAAPPAIDIGGSSFLNAFLAPQPQPQQESAPATTGQRTFFDDIFNIPISTLGAVSRFLSNSVSKPTAIQVEKTITTH